MKHLVLAIALALGLAGVAGAQTFTLPAPSAPNNTMVCLTISSTTQINGTALGQMHVCYPLPDASVTALLAAYGEPCGAALTPPGTCTPSQIMALLGQSIANDVQNFVSSYAKNAAANAAAQAVAAPTIGAPTQ